MLNIKGFIGPIGDDLPSLVPILIALTVFFAAFANTLQIFGDKSAQFDSDLGVMQVVRTLKSDNYMNGINEWEYLCNTITPKQFKYYGGITENYANFALGEPDPFDPKWMDSKETGTPYVCTNLEPGDPPLSVENMADYDVVVSIYPLAVEEERKVRIAHLLVVSWD